MIFKLVTVTCTFLYLLSLFGHQDVDLRAGSSCWTQVKVKSENVGDRNAMLNARKPEEDRLREDSSSKILRSPGPAAPTNSLPPIPPVACDPLGRPLVYNRLPSKYRIELCRFQIPHFDIN